MCNNNVWMDAHNCLIASIRKHPVSKARHCLLPVKKRRHHIFYLKILQHLQIFPLCNISLSLCVLLPPWVELNWGEAPPPSQLCWSAHTHTHTRQLGGRRVVLSRPPDRAGAGEARRVRGGGEAGGGPTGGRPLRTAPCPDTPRNFLGQPSFTQVGVWRMIYLKMCNVKRISGKIGPSVELGRGRYILSVSHHA